MCFRCRLAPTLVLAGAPWGPYGGHWEPPYLLGEVLMYDERHSWAHTVLGGMAKSVVLSLFPNTARVVDVSCQSCGEGLALVTEAANGPWLTVWSPANGATAGAGETLWAMAAGPLPRDIQVNVHCFAHGPGVVDPIDLFEKVDRFRSSGSCQQLPVVTQLAEAG